MNKKINITECTEIDFFTIPTHPNYEINVYGQIYRKERMSIWTRNRRHIIPRKKINSYFSKTSEYLMASIDNKHYCIHKLLAETFIENPNNYPVVDHLDGNKINNNLDNLEWCSHSENTKRAYDNGLCSRNRKVLCVEENIIFNSCRDAGKWLGNESKSSHILQVGNGKRKTAYGYHWKFV